MQCNKCGSTWDTSEKNKLIGKCPFCGAIVDSKESFDSIEDVLKYIYNNYENDFFIKRGILVSLVSDLAPQFNLEKHFLQICSESGIIAELLISKSDDKNKQEITYRKSFATLEKRYGLSSIKAKEVLQWFVYAYDLDIRTDETDQDSSRNFSAENNIITTASASMNTSLDSPIIQTKKKSNRWIPIVIIITILCILAIVIAGGILRKQSLISGTIDDKDVKVNKETSAVAHDTTNLEVNYQIGDVIRFGMFNQDNNDANGTEPIEWIVLDTDGNRMLVISRYALDCKPYNNIPGNTSWAECSLRYWLNNSFLYDAFTKEEQQKISTINSPLTDKIFVLSVSEVSHYFASAPSRMTSATQTAVANGSYQENDVCGWWLRDMGDTSQIAARVNIHGEIVTYDSTEGGVERSDYSVRPAMWISL